MNEIIKRYEERLRIAMMNSDTQELDKLLADDLLFISHLGQFISKKDDISAHEQRLFKLLKIDIIRQDIRIVSDIAVVVSHVEIDVMINNQTASDSLIYTRIWQNFDDEWKIVGGQATQVI